MIVVVDVRSGDCVMSPEWAELRGEVRWAIARLNEAFRPDHFTNWPGHYRPGVEYIAPADVIRAIAEALAQERRQTYVA